MKVFVDADLCTGCNCCEDIAPEVFGHRLGAVYLRKAGEDGVAEVPIELEHRVIQAAEHCPGEIIDLRA